MSFREIRLDCGQAIGEEIVTPFRAEHAEIRVLRDEVLAEADSGGAPFNLCLQLCNVIQSHMQREDMMLFPSARDVLDAEALEISYSMGKKVCGRKTARLLHF